ncbi:hypothetical protein Poli38472_003494 [Pythium oligandrum]|uniref:G-protein coupled receptors family 2 profile 2 domain-containing protein n=1 Tax=Pythium oligandrum TaxID=41045 RepID=A0A8K1FE42_PYTOL|nr:hypothetical protein Poli38472_003494 [Pythium oligandrum]|eukprot:TMW57569.1 hypothetical protein Poli38472_003494 [Pythium oligandrum]
MTMTMRALTATEEDANATLHVVEEVLLIVSSVVSFLGCAFIFMTWKSFSLPNYLSRRIVASMGLAGLITAFGFSLSIVVNGLGTQYLRHEALCYTQAFLLQYFYLASYLWTACFAFHLYQIIVVRNEYPERLLWTYRVIGWGLPGLPLLYLVLRQLTGHLGVGATDRRWCWISVHTHEEADAWQRSGAWQQLLLFYVPIGFVFVFNSVMYRIILKYLAMDPMSARLKRRVVLYLVIFFLCSIWGVINRLVQFGRADHQPNTFLTVMECICDPLQPLLNAVVYGTNRSMLDAYKERFFSSWFYTSLVSSDDEESGLDKSTSLLSHEDSTEDVNGDDSAFYYQDMLQRKLTYPSPEDEMNGR